MKKHFLWGLILMCVTGMSLTACGGDDNNNDAPTTLTVNPTSISMYYDGSQQLSAQGATSWTSENEFVAKVDQNGLVKGGHVGTTNIIASNGTSTGRCTVTIVPKYNLYDTPILNWGATMSQIRATETHTLAGSGSDYLGYGYTNGSRNAVVTYTFKNGGLNGIVVILNKNDYVNLGYYLIERYLPIGSSDGMYIFADALLQSQTKTIIGLDYITVSGTKYAGATYIPNTSSSSSAPKRSMLHQVEIPAEILSVLDE